MFKAVKVKKTRLKIEKRIEPYRHKKKLAIATTITKK